MATSESLKDLLKTTPETLAKLQTEALKQHMLKTLNRVIYLINEGNWNLLEDMCQWSPAGDGMGTDHHFIDFNWDDGADDGVDIIEVIQKIRSIGG
jgi:hypothetical protein